MDEQPPLDPTYPEAPHTVAGQFGEATLVEEPAMELMRQLGWEVVDLYHEWASGTSTEGRASEHEVVLVRRLRLALAKLNPDIPETGLTQAIEELTRDRSKMVPANANQEVYRLLKDGVPVTVPDKDGGDTVERVTLVDWQRPENNAFLLASQFWVSGDMYRRRAIWSAFVNGLPLVFVRAEGDAQDPEERVRRQPDRLPRTPSRSCSGRTGSSSCRTAASRRSAPSLAPWDTSSSGSGSTTRARRASCRWTR